MYKIFLGAFLICCASLGHAQSASLANAFLGAKAIPPGQLTFAESLHNDNVCLVRKAFELEDYATRRQSIPQVVDACITLDQGSGLWYVQTKQRDGQAVSATDPVVQSTLKASKRLSGAYLAQALAHCEAKFADEQECLRQWSLVP